MTTEATILPEARLAGDEHISLCETLDRVLNAGVVLVGDVLISVADVDLIFIGLQVVLTSMETARNSGMGPPASNLVRERES
ncbi:MAG: gas vesicle protein [Isosphaeraceae bacterium]|nr:gas vesicle protein [Isosphaeraceae bacterium]